MQTWHFCLCMCGLSGQSCWLLVASGGHQLPVPTICFYPKIELNLLIKIELTCNKCGKHANITEEKKNLLIYKSNHNWRLTMPLYAEQETCGPWQQVLLMVSKALEVFLISWTKYNKIPLRIDAVAYSA